MSEVSSLSPASYGYGFIPPEYLRPGEDEYWQRNRQAGAGRSWRALKGHEAESLIKNGNYCPDWDRFLVRDPFDPALVRNSIFYGLVRLGALREILIRRHDFSVPTGIRNSTIISCDIGDDTAVQDCSYVSHYLIGDRVILSRIDELQTTNHAKFGNGVIKEGEDERVRIEIDVMNEAGGRSILPFADMIPADAFLWAAYRDDRELAARLRAMTQEEYGGRRGAYGVIGDGAVIKSSRIIKDVLVGGGAYIKGANKLKNLTIHSSEEEPTQIGEGVELVNGIVGYGCHAFYGVKAVRFVMGRNSSLKYGARLIHSVLGDNSTVSCCEILNNLIFPVHEQHHNNSFLIAALIQGMSNLAAGATIGSNHNSRANDGEIRAGRGFWPGLSVTLKHSSRFAGFVIIAKGNYPYELNISLPFSLVNNNASKNRLEVMPAYFWMYNLYALERNSWKAEDRDRRKVKVQRIETGYLAPDTAEEIIAALGLLELWMARAGMAPEDFSGNSAAPVPADEDPEYEYVSTEDEEIPAEGLERHHRGAVILKPRKARTAYRQMLHYYAVKTLFRHFEARPGLGFAEFLGEMARPGEGGPGRVTGWVNLGGQVVPAFRLDALRGEIRGGEISTWGAVHAAYDRMAAAYGEDRLRHAWGTLEYLKGGDPLPDAGAFVRELEALGELQRWIAEQVYLSRAKDFHDPFRGITYRNKAEMDAVAGTARDNFFVKLVERRSEETEAALEALKQRLLNRG